MSFARSLRPVLRSTAPTASRGHAVAVDAPFLPPSPSVQQSEKRRYVDGDVRHDWRRSEIQKVFDAPLMEIIYRAVGNYILEMMSSKLIFW